MSKKVCMVSVVEFVKRDADLLREEQEINNDLEMLRLPCIRLYKTSKGFKGYHVPFFDFPSSRERKTMKMIHDVVMKHFRDKT